MDVLVHDEQHCDVAGVRALVRAAFGRIDEAILVDRLRDDGALVVSKVLKIDDEVIAHAGTSPMSWVCGTVRPVIWALAPVSVKPEMQRRGFGKQIVRATINRCRAAGAEILTVLGDPSYYRRFGFAPASQHLLQIENADYGDAFMVMELVDGALSDARGSLRWHRAFDTLEEE